MLGLCPETLIVFVFSIFTSAKTKQNKTPQINSVWKFFSSFWKNILFYVYRWFALCMYTMCMQCLWRSVEGIESCWTRVINDGKWPCGCWKQNLDPLQKKKVLSTAKPSLWNMSLILNCWTIRNSIARHTNIVQMMFCLQASTLWPYYLSH